MPEFTGPFRSASLATLALMLLSASPVWAADCSPLDPRVSISKDYEGKASASAGALFKLGNVSGEISGKGRQVIQNLVQNAPPNEQDAIKLRALYLYCEIVAGSDKLTPEQKIHLLNEITVLKDQPTRLRTPSTKPVSKHLSESKSIRPADEKARESAPPSNESAVTNNKAPPAVVGYEVIGNQQGGVADEVTSQGGPNSVGRDITVCGKPGQSVTGMRVIQSGPGSGTGERVVQMGPGTGVKITVYSGGCPPGQ